MANIGITTTIPAEVIYAAGHVPVDLNNIFITDPDPAGLVRMAEEDGLPRALCSWVKGIYSVILRNPGIDTIIAVTEGDCANTLAMLDLLSSRGISIITFAYPFSYLKGDLDRAISQLESVFGVNRIETEEWRRHLRPVREKALRVDELTWKENLVSGLENHLSLISCSDFEGNPEQFGRKLDLLIEESSRRKPFKRSLRLGVCGVPTVYSNLYGILEELGVGVVFNEMQLQFAMPDAGNDIVDQYLSYTYPYASEHRIRDINENIMKRRIDGMIHYVQSFCHHQIQAKHLRESLTCPVLTLEGDRPGPVLERSRIRLESFIEMLHLRSSGICGSANTSKDLVS